MNCQEVQEQVHLYIDDELDMQTRRTIASHVLGCSACSAAYAQQRALASLLSSHASDFRASPQLRARVVARLPNEETKRAFSLPRSGWWSAAGAAVLAATITWGVAEQQRAADREDGFKDDAVTVHRRSLLESHLVDIASSQPAQLEQWLGKRLSYPVRVKDLSAQGYELVGARVDYLYAQRLAAIVYRRGTHLVNVLAWPVSKTDDFPVATMNDEHLHVRFLVRGDTNFCVISDLDAQEFDAFMHLLTSA